MEYRIRAVRKHKNGGTASKNSYHFRCTLPNEWVEQLGIDGEAKFSFDGKKIIIEANN